MPIAGCVAYALSATMPAMGLYDRDYMHEPWRQQGVIPNTRRRMPPALRPRMKRPSELAPALWAVLFLAVATGFVALLSLAGFDFAGFAAWLLGSVR